MPSFRLRAIHCTPLLLSLGLSISSQAQSDPVQAAQKRAAEMVSRMTLRSEEHTSELQSPC